MSTETGMIKDTSLYREFYEYVIKKFGSMSAFAMILHGNFYALQGVYNISDNKKGRTKIWWLDKQAHELDYDESKVYISESDLLRIKLKVRGILTKKNITLAEWQRRVNYKPFSYSNIISGGNNRKNKSYEELCKILFE